VTLCLTASCVPAASYAPRVVKNELTVRNRIPVCARAVHRGEIGEAALERDKDLRLDQPFPEGAHLLARQHGEQIDALVCSPRTARGTSSGSCLVSASANTSSSPRATL